MKFIKILIAFPLIIALGEPAIAQVQRSMSFDASTSLMLQELSAMIVQNDDGIQVEMILGDHGNASDMSDNLQRGDVILMMNGERITDVTSMREIYEAIPDEEEIKIGVRRGDQRFIVRATKGDIPERAGMQMVMNVESDDGTPPVIVAELGIVLSLIDEQIQIQALLEPLMPQELKDENLEGFTIITVNGETFEAAEEVQRYIAALEVGNQIDLVVEKDGEQKAITFDKQEARGAVNMSIDN